MANTNYIYSISSDTLNEAVSGGKLQQEIVNDQAIIIAPHSISTTGDVLTVTMKDALPTEQKDQLDVLVGTHDGVPEQGKPSPVILEPTGDSSKDLIICGDMFTAALDGTTYRDIVFSEERLLQGVSMSVQDATLGDRIRTSIVMLQEDPAPDIEVRVLSEGVGENLGTPVPPSGSLSVVSEGTAAVPAGIAIRVSYLSTATSGNQPVIIITLRQWR